MEEMTTNIVRQLVPTYDFSTSKLTIQGNEYCPYPFIDPYNISNTTDVTQPTNSTSSNNTTLTPD